ESEFFPTLAGGTAGSAPLAWIEVNTTQQYSIGRLQQSWALLLRLYTGRTSVSFRYFCTSISRDNKQSATLTKILSYHASTSGDSVEMKYRASYPVDHQTLDQERANTAVVLYCPDDGAESRLPLRIHETELASLHLISIASRQPRLVLQYRSDSIPLRYAKSIAQTFGSVLTAPQNTDWRHLTLEAAREYFYSWNNQHLEPSDTCVQALVGSAVQSDPTAEAVCAWDGRVSYQELDNWSSILAVRLGHMGVTKGKYVACAFSKSSWAVVAMLGVLKAGAAFVALDPNQSTDRLQQMLQVLECNVLITSELHVEKLSPLAQCLVVSSDAIAAYGSACISEHRPPEVQASDAAVVLFTSGSTGRPKAMVHEHGSICSHAVALGDAMGYRGARVLQFSAYIWDVAVMDIFITLIYGGCVCIPSEADRLDDIAAFIRWSDASMALLTPSYARSIDPDSVPGLKTLALAGECMTREDIQRWGKHVTLMNAYGPAEVGVCSLNSLVDNQPENIGHALRNSPCWLVDPNDVNRLVPLGAVGELLVGGPNLAREYINQPELTASSFVVDPVWAGKLGLECRRFYRTGDLMSYDMTSLDGSMIFLGRKDDQMKVRGQRIEPGEIEYHICRIPAVRAAVVTMPRHGYWKNELVAVLETGEAHVEALLSWIKDHLSKSIPHYMVPTAYITVSQFPLTASMKIDRREVRSWLEESAHRLGLTSRASRPLNRTPLARSEKTAWAVSAVVEQYLRGLKQDREIIRAGYNFSLQEAGLDSIRLIALFSTLRTLYGDVVSLPAAMRTGLTIRNIARLIDSPGRLLDPSIDVQSECRSLSEQLLASLPRLPNRREIRNVFLTGASGYLGSQILRRLLCHHDAHVYVHLRRRAEGSHDPIKERAILEGWWDRCFHSRYTIWPGDLTKEGLGLTRSHLELLHGQGPPDKVVNGVIHCGALVHYTLDYETLRQPNVGSTIALLDATAKSQYLRSFVFISGGRNPTQLDSGEVDSVLWNGYSQSKYVSEEIISACSHHPAFDSKILCTVSPGYIIGSADGRANTRDFIWKLIGGCIEIGAYNQDEASRWLYVYDVAGVSQISVSELFGGKGGRQCITKGVQFQTIWDILRVEFGYRLGMLAGDKWLARLKAAVLRTGESHSLFPLLPALEATGQRLGDQDIPSQSDAEVAEAIRQNVKYLIRTGFFPKALCVASSGLV
ncbi:hypothetical protein BDV10DRAFT_108144, partial [Aspergillus recurvatus]